MANLDSWLGDLRSPGGLHRLRGERDELIDEAGRHYVVTDGIPRLLDAKDVAGDDAHWNRFYDWFAPLYEHSEHVFSRLLTGLDMRKEQLRLVKSLPITPGSTLLEICTGPGVYQPWLARAVAAQGRLAALDLSWGMIRRCAHRTRAQHPAPLCVQGNGAALPFAAGTFDFVFHFGGIKLFSSPEIGISECARVLRPGGLLFLGDESYIPTIPAKGWRRRLILRMNPGFRRPPPQVPASLKLEKEDNVYDGLAFLWTLRRVDA